MKTNGEKKRLYALIKLNGKILLALLLSVALGAAAMFTVQGVTREEGVEIPVVMYHSVLQDEMRHGKYVISPDEFESDLAYLKDHGYTTILIADLISYTRGGTLPEKPVLLTFDDGYFNNYLYAYPLAQKYQSKFVLSPIGFYADEYTDTPDENAYYSHATWEQLREMADSGLVEIQNHSYNLHKSQGGRLGVQRVSSESPEQYEAMLTKDLKTAQEKISAHIGAPPACFVYPFGATSKGTGDIVKKLGFSASLSCEERVSRVTRDPESLWSLGRYLRVSGVSSKAFFEEKMKLSS